MGFKKYQNVENIETVTPDQTDTIAATLKQANVKSASELSASQRARLRDELDGVPNS